ncbi:hypothetical protein [Ensifer canadensis]
MGPTNKKKQNDDWLKNAIPVTDDEWLSQAIPVSDDEWMSQAVAVPDGPDESQLDPSQDAPARVRFEVGALDKPEDRLRTIKKFYPDAKPYGDGNFIYTDPETKKVRLYNTESWFPSLGDAVSASPEIAEGIGGILGAIGGATVGSAAPGPGTVAGGILGAGAGAVGFRGALQDTVNWWNGNEDTRTTGEVIKDDLGTFAINAAGEGVGRAALAGGKAVVNGGKRMLGVPDYSKLGEVVGPADDIAQAAMRRDDLRAIGIEPTAGMVSGTPKAAHAEHALLPTKFGEQIQSRINDAFGRQGDEFERIVSGISTKPLTKAETGVALREQAEALKTAAKAETDRLYTETRDLATAPATVDATSNFIQALQGERTAQGAWSAKTKGKQADEVLSHAADIVAEARSNGWSFMDLKDARSTIGKMASDTEDTVLQGHLNRLRDALTTDMDTTANAAGPDAVKSWKAAETAFKDRISPETGFGRGGQGFAITTAKDTDKLFDTVFSESSRGGNKIASTRRLIEKSDGGKEAWHDMTAGFVDRLGRNPQGEYSGTQFMKNWNKMSPEAKDAVFGGTKSAAYRADLDRLARIAENMQKYGRKANHSNTKTHDTVLGKFTPTKVIGAAFGIGADILTTGGIGTTSALTGMAGAAAISAAKNGAQKETVNMLTSPETVKWLTEVPGASMKKGGMVEHLKRLGIIAAKTSNAALRTEINAYFRQIGYENDNK